MLGAKPPHFSLCSCSKHIFFRYMKRPADVCSESVELWTDGTETVFILLHVYCQFTMLTVPDPKLIHPVAPLIPSRYEMKTLLNSVRDSKLDFLKPPPHASGVFHLSQISLSVWWLCWPLCTPEVVLQIILALTCQQQLCPKNMEDISTQDTRMWNKL